MKEVAEGRAGVDANLAEHLYRCLGCRACETACPSSVPFGKLLERGRLQVELHGDLNPDRSGWRFFRSLAFETVMPKPWLFSLVMAPARLLQMLPGLLSLLFMLPLPKRLHKLLGMIPAGTGSPVAPGTIFQAVGQRRARVALFTGCVMNSLFAHVNQATARVLTRNGCEVVAVAGQWCCGALNVHAGERRNAIAMARKNIAAFGAAKLDAIIVNSAGCGAMLKEYAELLNGDAEAARFSSLVRDVSEYLDQLGLHSDLRPVRERVTYQDACHLAHAQRIRRAPRALLRQVPGLDYVELPHADRCCGAAGVYNLTQPVFSEAILREKLDDIAETQARVVVTTNPGCAMQLQAGVRERRMAVRICHLVELLDRSYRTGP